MGSIVNNGNLVKSCPAAPRLLGAGVVSNGTEIDFVQTIAVPVGATLDNATILKVGILVVFSGVVASGTAINNGGTEIVASGGIENSATIDGTLDLQSGGIVTAGTLDADGTLEVDSGSTVNVTGANSIDILSGGTSVGSILNNGGTVEILSGGTVTVVGGTASGIVISNSGTEIVNAGAVDSGAMLSGGQQDVFGSTTSVTIDNSAIQVVESGGIASGTIVNATVSAPFVTDEQSVVAGGSAFGTVVNSGGLLDIDGNGAVVSGATIAPGGMLSIEAAVISTTDGGATFEVLSNGTSVGDIVNSGASNILDGGTIDFVGNNTFDNATINVGTVNTGAVVSSVDAGGGAVLIFGPNATVFNDSTATLTGGTGGTDGIVNSGTIDSFVSGGALTIDPLNFTNDGTITVSAGDTVTISAGNFTNFVSGDLSGGTYNIGANSTLNLSLGGNFVTQLDATVILGDSGAAFNSVNINGTPVGIDQTLSTIGPNGALYVEGGASPSFGNLSDAGILQLGGADTTVGGIAIVGTRDVVLDPTAGGFVDVIGTISDGAGTGGSGVGTVTVDGGADVELDGTNTYTGGTIVSGSTLLQIFNSDNALGGLASTLSLGDGTALELSQNTNPAYTIFHNIAIAGNATLQPDTGTTITVSGQIAGTGTLNVGVFFNAGGTLVLANPLDSYTGGTVIDAGSLEIASAGAAGTGGITFAPQVDPRLQIDSGAFVSSGPNAFAFANVISGFGQGDDIDLTGVPFASLTSVTINAADLLTVSAGGSTYSPAA